MRRYDRLVEEVRRLVDNLPQAEIAQRTGLAQSTISNLIHGRRVSLETVLKFARGMGEQNLDQWAEWWWAHERGEPDRRIADIERAFDRLLADRQLNLAGRSQALRRLPAADKLAILRIVERESGKRYLPEDTDVQQ